MRFFLWLFCEAPNPDGFVRTSFGEYPCCLRLALGRQVPGIAPDTNQCFRFAPSDHGPSSFRRKFSVDESIDSQLVNWAGIDPTETPVPGNYWPAAFAVNAGLHKVHRASSSGSRDSRFSDGVGEVRRSWTSVCREKIAVFGAFAVEGISATRVLCSEVQLWSGRLRCLGTRLKLERKNTI